MPEALLSAPVDPLVASDAAGHCQSLKDVHAELAGLGLFEPTGFWRRKLLLWVPVLLISYIALLALPFGVAWLLAVPVGSVAFLTMGFLGHDAGHYAISRKRWINDFWGQIGMTIFCGMTFGFWRSSHNRHHAHCQE